MKTANTTSYDLTTRDEKLYTPARNPEILYSDYKSNPLIATRGKHEVVYLDFSTATARVSVDAFGESDDIRLIPYIDFHDHPSMWVDIGSKNWTSQIRLGLNLGEEICKKSTEFSSWAESKKALKNKYIGFNNFSTGNQAWVHIDYSARSDALEDTLIVYALGVSLNGLIKAGGKPPQSLFPSVIQPELLTTRPRYRSLPSTSLVCM